MSAPKLIVLTTALVLAACKPASSPPDEKAVAASAASQAVDTQGVYRFTIGSIEAIVLDDGAGSVPNDGKTFGIDEGPQKVAAVLAAAGLSTDKMDLGVNVLVLRAADRLFVIDTGNGPGAGGALLGRLSQAGVTPEKVTDIVITHGHGDHVGGLLDAAGTAAFPNARVHVAAAELASMRVKLESAALLRTLQPRFVSFTPGSTFAPGISAVEVRGHTPGHTAVSVESSGQRMLAIGDTAHHYVVSLREPEYTIAFDADAPTAEANRRALLIRAVDEGLTLYAPHFPFPGVGVARREGTGFAFVPTRT